jgi:aspartyl-tRNA(Asn)/glutamyl-tRNA(Gln) amidotransferase subunit B
LEHEIDRQQAILGAGGEVKQETLGWDDRANVTLSQRGKEEADDYRYFPEPDLPPLVIQASWIEDVRRSLPELPSAKRRRLVAEYGLSEGMASLISDDPEIASYYESAARSASRAKPESVANWLTGDLFAWLNETDTNIRSTAFSSDHLAELVELVESGTINATVGKEVLGRSFESGALPGEIVAEAGLEQESDPALLREIVERILERNPDQVSDYLGGKRTILDWFFGQVMKETRGRADPSVVRSTLEEALDTLSQRTDTG